MNLKLFIIFFLFPIAISANDWSSSNEWSSGKDWTPINRDKALGLLNSNSPKERREALGRLADVGFFEDTPKMLVSLWDSEYSVRKMAENAIWGLWLRADDPYIDSVFQRAIVEVQGSEYEIALQMFKNVTELKPEFAEGWNKLGDVYFALNDFENDTFTITLKTEHDYNPARTWTNITYDFAGGALGWGAGPWGEFPWGDIRLPQLKKKLASKKVRSLRVILENSIVYENVLVSGLEFEVASPYAASLKE